MGLVSTPSTVHRPGDAKDGDEVILSEEKEAVSCKVVPPTSEHNASFSKEEAKKAPNTSDDQPSADSSDVEMGTSMSMTISPSNEKVLSSGPDNLTEEEGVEPLALQRNSAVRTMEPGAVRVYPRGYRNAVENDNDGNSSQASEQSSTPLDEDLLNDQEPEIQGVLVNNRQEEEQIQQIILGGMEYAPSRLLDQDKAALSRKRTRQARLGSLFLCLLVFFAVIVSVTVSVRNRSSQENPTSSSQFAPVSTAPSRSMAPSMQPSRPLSKSPSVSPSVSPTHMSWQPLPNGFTLGRQSNTPDLQSAEFGRDVTMASIQNQSALGFLDTREQEADESAILVASTYLFGDYALEFMVCNPQICTESGHVLRGETFHPEDILQISLSHDARWLALMVYQWGFERVDFEAVVYLYDLHASDFDVTRALPLNHTPLELSRPQVSTLNLKYGADVSFGLGFLAVLSNTIVVYNTTASDLSDPQIIFEWAPNNGTNVPEGTLVYQPVLMATSHGSPNILAVGSNLNEVDRHGNIDHLNSGFRVDIFDVQQNMLLQTIANNDSVAILSRESMALSSDGNVLAMTYFLHHDAGIHSSGIPSVEVFERQNETEWIRRGQILTETESGNFGWSVDLNHDGTLLVVGAPTFRRTTGGFDAETGRVFTFAFDGEEWVPFGSQDDLLGSVDSRFGNSVALSPQSDFLAISAPRHSNGVGSTQILHQVGV